MHTYIHTCLNTYIQAYIFTYIYASIHTYIHTHRDKDILIYTYVYTKYAIYIYTHIIKHKQIYMPILSYTGCPRRKGSNFGRVFLRSNYNDITQNTYMLSTMIKEISAREFWNLTAITHLLITKYILKLAGICGFCNVNICT